MKLITLSRKGERNPPITTKISAHVGVIELLADAARFSYQFAVLGPRKHLLRNGQCQGPSRALALEIETCRSLDSWLNVY